MREDSGIGPGVTVRGDLLWIEKVEVCITDGLRDRMKACGQGLSGRQREIRLSERIDRGDFRYVEGKRQCTDWYLVVDKLRPFGERGAILNRWPTEREILGVADLRPRKWPLRIRNSGKGSLRS
jgi:hypothetical protein